MSTLLDNAKLDRIANSVHAAIALDEGMKAGFRAYMASPGHNRELDSLPKKAAFDRYCGEFGPYLDVLADVQEPELDELDALRAEIDELKAELKAARKGSKTQAQPAARKAKKAPKAKVSEFVGRESTFSNAVIERKGLPTEVGDTFRWKGANGTSTWEVVEDYGDGIAAIRIA